MTSRVIDIQMLPLLRKGSCVFQSRKSETAENPFSCSSSLPDCDIIPVLYCPPSGRILLGYTITF